MTKEELEKEAEKYAEEYQIYVSEYCSYNHLVKAYLASAEPREKQIADLEKENAELKTKKIPQLERRIASIRGAHSVDCRKLNARTEQVERLKKENAELREKLEIEQNARGDWFGKAVTKDEQLTKAKEIMNIAIEGIKHWGIVGGTERPFEKQAEKLFNLFLDKAEQFLNSEVEK